MASDKQTQVNESASLRPVDRTDRKRTVVIAAANNSLDGHICTQLSYTDSRSGWVLLQRPFPWKEQDPNTGEQRPDGCLSWATHELEIESVCRLGVPTVNMSGGVENSPLPTVTNDNHEIGRLAARHLLHDCAMPNLGFVSISPNRYAWSRRRLEGFREVANNAGLDCHELARPLRPGVLCALPDEMLAKWLQQLPRPIGIMAADDWCALAVIRACHLLKIAIPQDIALIGANNDLICSMTVPTLSSVDRNEARVVLEAAAALEKLMDGAPSQTGTTYIPPLGVVRRDSTNTLAVGDSTIAAAIEYIRANVDEPFNIKTLAKRFGVSSKTLARGFARWLHCRPGEFVMRVRLARAKELLREPHKLHIIAKVSGFSDEKQLRVAFKRAMGMSPQDYRRQVMASSSITR